MNPSIPPMPAADLPSAGSVVRRSYLLFGLTLLGLTTAYFAVPPKFVERQRQERQFAVRHAQLQGALDELARLALVTHLDAVRGHPAADGPHADLVGELAFNSRAAMDTQRAAVARLAAADGLPGAAPLAERLSRQVEAFQVRPDSVAAVERILVTTKQLAQLSARAAELREEERRINPLENQRVVTGLLLAVLAGIVWAGLRIRQSSRRTLRALDETIRQRNAQTLALQRERDFATGLIDTAPVIILLLDLRGSIQHVNPYFERLTGYRLDEVKGRDWFATFLPARDRDRIRTLFQTAARDVPTRGNINPIVTRSGEERDIEWHDQVLRDAQGNITSLLVIGLDLTDRRRAEEEIRNLAKYPAENPQPILRLDREGVILYANEGSQILLREWGCQVGGPTPSMLGDLAKEALTRRERKEIDVECGERTYAFVLAPIPDAGYVNLYGRDITDRKRVEEQLRQAQRLEAVGRLAGGVAHDFNNLLNGIIGFAELALRELPPGSEAHDHLSRVPPMGRQAADLVARLLAFARRASQERKPLDLNALLRETVMFLRRTLPATLTLRVDPAPEPVVVQADLAQMQQIFLNLATNAQDAMPGGGTLSLRLVSVTLTAESVGGNPERRPGDFVCLTVADTGTGIPAAIRDRIFDPFFTTKAVGEGTGLGLASVHGTVHQHDGWLEVETAEGQGTAFHIFLPRLPGPAPVAPAAAESLPRGTETLLLVEDNPMLLELGAILLTELGYIVLTAREGIEGLAVCRVHPEIALVLTDAIMPRMGAAALIPALRALNPSVKVLVATGYASAEIRTALDHLPLLGYLQKPFRQTDLAMAVRAALDGPAPGSG